MTEQQAASGRGAIRILSSTAFKSVMADLGPLFERRCGAALQIEYGTSNQLAGRIKGGELADLALLTGSGIDELVMAERLAAGSRMDLAQTGIGIAVRTGAPHPDIGTVAAFKSALLEAPSVTYTATGASGVYFATVLERLGIIETIRAKAKIPAGGLIGELLVRGEAQLGVQLISELLAVPGVSLVGPLPRELQNTTVFSIGTFAATVRSVQAEAFYRFLGSAEARRVMQDKGMQAV